MDVTGLGGCPRMRSCCRKATRERLLVTGELIAAGRPSAWDREGKRRARLLKRPGWVWGMTILGRRGKEDQQG